MSGKSRRVLASMLVIVLVAVLTIPTSAFGVKATGKVSAQAAAFAPDEYEPDDSDAEAYEYDPAVDGNTYHSIRTFHGTSDATEDFSDYIAVTVDATGTPIWVEEHYLNGDWDPYTYIYSEDDTTTALASADDYDYWEEGLSDGLYFVTPAPGTYYVEITNRNMIAEYELFITVGDARRVWGSSRYGTAAEVSRLQSDDTGNVYYGSAIGKENIIIGNGKNPADALVGGALATQLGGVLLLTERDYLPQETYDEIMRVTESLYWYDWDVTVWVLGGENAVSKEVFQELESIRNVTQVNRIAGTTRYETAAEIADTTVAQAGVGSTAYIVNGSAWADALAVAPVAAWDAAPVLMTAASDVPTVTMDWLAANSITNVVVVGGTGVVSPAAFAELEVSYDTTRVAGTSRYETAKKVALWGVDNAGMNGSLATLVSGENFADALSAAPIGWYSGAPVLLTTKNALHPMVGEYFAESGSIGIPYNGSDGTGCYVIGGPAAISESTYEAFRDLWMTLVVE